MEGANIVIHLGQNLLVDALLCKRVEYHNVAAPRIDIDQLIGRLPAMFRSGISGPGSRFKKSATSASGRNGTSADVSVRITARLLGRPLKPVSRRALKHPSRRQPAPRRAMVAEMAAAAASGPTHRVKRGLACVPVGMP